MAVAAMKSNRTASKEARRQQLIEATVKCISKRGIGSTTLGDVAKEAGLSQGIVNLHFESKDNLFNETLRYLAEEYKSLFEKTLEKSGPGAADKLLALMELDLKPSVCDQKKSPSGLAFGVKSKRCRPIARCAMSMITAMIELLNAFPRKSLRKASTTTSMQKTSQTSCHP